MANAAITWAHRSTILCVFVAGCSATGTSPSSPGDAGRPSSPSSGGAHAPNLHPDGNLPLAAGRASAPAAGSGSEARCHPPALDPLFNTPSATPPIVERRADAVIVTRGAGRVRGRHELEGTFSQFGERYFENRSFNFTIEDSVAAGGSTVKFTYRPEAPVSAGGPVTNFRHWKMYGEGNVFHTNVSMKGLTSQLLEYTATSNGRESRPIRSGDVLEFEFGVFIAGQNDDDPDAIEGRTSYYSDTFRYRVGRGGLTPYNDDSSGRPGPSDAAALAGTTTIPWIYAEPELSFSQMALVMQAEHVQPFLRGRRLFHTDFATGKHSEPNNPVFMEQAGKQGPLFNSAACVDCHVRDGRGQPPAVGAELESMAIKLYAPAALGTQLQQQEGRALLDRFETREIVLGDGSKQTLERPMFRYSGVDASTLRTSIRVARQMPGMGLLEAIPEAQILARADADDCDGDGISGRAQAVPDPREPGRRLLGRFGWKAEKLSVAHQVADALSADMGVSSPLAPEPDGRSELNQRDFDDLVSYSSLIALPARRDLDAADVQAGAKLFAAVGCVRCHAPDASTGGDHPFVELRDQTIHPYTDLLLHDMGPDLADDSGSAQASEWRTPPLWGLGMLETVSGHTRLLHDGRARGPLEAVLWHGGEAAFARDGVMLLNADERRALLAFLGSL